MTACRHHWDIESANGPTSRGRCRRCGEEQDFRTSDDGQRLNPSRNDAVLIARVKRDEAALATLIHNFGQEGHLPLTAYRRNARREDGS